MRYRVIKSMIPNEVYTKSRQIEMALTLSTSTLFQYFERDLIFMMCIEAYSRKGFKIVGGYFFMDML